MRVQSVALRARQNRSKTVRGVGSRRAVGLSTLNAQLSTFRRGTVLVLVIAILSMLALLATTFLVTARYDQIAAGGSALSHQMEMLLSMLEGSIRHVLTQDQWGDDPAHNNPGDPSHEAYDAPDDAHAWLKGVCGNLIEWEASANAPDYVQAVTDGENGWKDLDFVTVDPDPGSILDVRVEFSTNGLIWNPITVGANMFTHANSVIMTPDAPLAFDLHNDRRINFIDYAVLMSEWLDTVLWP